MSVEPKTQYQRDASEFDAIGKALMLCINACHCPVCLAEAGETCKSSGGHLRPHHVPRIKAGHVLLATPVEEVSDRLFKSMHREQPKRIYDAIQKALARSHP